MVKPWPIEIDGLPFLKMVNLSTANRNKFPESICFSPKHWKSMLDFDFVSQLRFVARTKLSSSYLPVTCLAALVPCPGAHPELIADALSLAPSSCGTADVAIVDRNSTIGHIWLWINTYENTIFRGMNIHFNPAILMWTTGVLLVLTHCHINILSRLLYYSRSCRWQWKKQKQIWNHLAGFGPAGQFNNGNPVKSLWAVQHVGVMQKRSQQPTMTGGCWVHPKGESYGQNNSKPPFLMVYTTHLWWIWEWFIVLTTLYNVSPPSYNCWFISPSNYSSKYHKP